MKLETWIWIVIVLLLTIVGLSITGNLDWLYYGVPAPVPAETNDITCVPGAVKQPDGTCILEN